jgi:hypothetical protein
VEACLGRRGSAFQEESTVSTTQNTIRRAAALSVVTGAAVLAAAPAYAGPNPEVSIPGAHQSRVAVDGHLSAGAGPSGPVPPSVQSKIEVMERAAQEQPAVPENRPSGGQDSDPASIPLVAATLLAGGLVAAGAGYTVYRLRHHGPVGAATA